MPAQGEATIFWSELDKLAAECRAENDRINRERNELQILQRQTESEIERLTERDMSIANRLRDMEVNLESYSRTDIKNIYLTAQETQMRLFMMRSQLEQLQSKQESIAAWHQRYEQISRVAELAGSKPGLETSMLTESIVPDQTDGFNEDSVAKIIEAQEEERLLISRQMHDGPAQSMTNLILRAEICERLLQIDATRAKEEMAALKQMINTTLQETRRFIFGIRPMILDDLGLTPTLHRYFEDVVGKTGLQVDLAVVGGDKRLPRHIETALFRIVQESLDNTIEHAKAAHATVNLEIGSSSVRVVIEDDGGGFDVQNAGTASNEDATKGLSGIRHRVDMLRGQMEMGSSLGQGTRIAVAIPLHGK